MSYSLLTEEEWGEEELKDPEEGIGHNRDLYVVWHEKTNFLKIASDNNFYNSSYFLWLDIGALRHKVVLKIKFYRLGQGSDIDPISCKYDRPNFFFEDEYCV